MSREFEWDEAKRRANLDKHGIDFMDLPTVFQGDTLTYEDDRYDYGECRYITLGQLGPIVVLIAHTETADTIRLIHARKAGKAYVDQYFTEIGNRLGPPEPDGGRRH